VNEKERTVVLGALLRRIGNFDMSTFNGRLVLQKTVYLFQLFGLYLGYKFSWYIHGPYSPDLTRDAFRLQLIYRDIPRMAFSDERIERGVGNFLVFLGGRKSDANWLEQLACTHFLKALDPKADRETIIEKVTEHEYHFSKEQCRKAWDYLVENDLITGREN